MRITKLEELPKLLGVESRVSLDGDLFEGKLYYKPKEVHKLAHNGTWYDLDFGDLEGYVFLCNDTEYVEFITGWYGGVEYIESIGHTEFPKKSTLYLAGDIMTKGSQLARDKEYGELLNKLPNTEIYSPIANKDINDKTNMTEEDNEGLAERIVKADVDRLLNSDTVVLEYQPHAIGTITELGILYGFRKAWQLVEEILDDPFELAYLKLEQIQKLGNKLNPKVFVHSDDLRNTNLNEKGFRRSHSINQFAYGVILDLAEDIKEWDKIVKELQFREEHVYND